MPPRKRCNDHPCLCNICKGATVTAKTVCNSQDHPRHIPTVEALLSFSSQNLILLKEIFLAQDESSTDSNETEGDNEVGPTKRAWVGRSEKKKSPLLFDLRLYILSSNAQVR